MTIEQMIEQRRDQLGTHGASLRAAQQRMDELNKKLSKQWRDGIVTNELLDKTISL